MGSWVMCKKCKKLYEVKDKYKEEACPECGEIHQLLEKTVDIRYDEVKEEILHLIEEHGLDIVSSVIKEVMK